MFNNSCIDLESIKEKFKEIRKTLKEISIPLYLCICCFTLSSWIDLNGLWVELPLLVGELPEAWDLPSYLVIIIQVANIGPIAFTLAKKLFPNWVQEWPVVYLIISVGVLSCILLSILWDRTTDIGGAKHSTALLALSALLSLVDCTSSVVYLPYMSYLPEQYMTAFFVGEGLSGLVPALIGIGQNVGSEPICSSNSVTAVNATIETVKAVTTIGGGYYTTSLQQQTSSFKFINTTDNLLSLTTTNSPNKTVTVAEGGSYPIYPPPNFTVSAFFCILAGLLFVSALGFTLVHFHFGREYILAAEAEKRKKREEEDREREMKKMKKKNKNCDDDASVVFAATAAAARVVAATRETNPANAEGGEISGPGNREIIIISSDSQTAFAGADNGDDDADNNSYGANRIYKSGYNRNNNGGAGGRGGGSGGGGSGVGGRVGGRGGGNDGEWDVSQLNDDPQLTPDDGEIKKKNSGVKLAVLDIRSSTASGLDNSNFRNGMATSASGLDNSNCINGITHSGESTTTKIGMSYSSQSSVLEPYPYEEVLVKKLKNGIGNKSAGDSNLKERVKDLIGPISMLLMIAWINGLGNGITPSLQTYTAIPYGYWGYTMLVQLGVLINPIACFLALFVRVKRVWVIGLLTLAGSILTAYQIGLAGLSPNPPLKGTANGSAAMVTTGVLMVAIFSFTKVQIATALQKRGGYNWLLYCGIATQAGSLIGAIIGFIIVNVTKLFAYASLC